MRKENQRNSAIELLRIISMLMIVAHHYMCHGGFEWATGSLTIPHCWYNLLLIGGKIGVNVFVLISGYFLVKSQKPLDFKRVLKFWGQIAFYSVVIYALACVFHLVEFNALDLAKSFLPITFEEWWFASSYFVLYLLHPFLNKLLTNLEKTKYQKLVILLIIIWSIIPTITTQSFQGSNLLWFITLYTIAGYIQLFGFKKKFTSKHYLIVFVTSILLTYLSSIVVLLVESKRSFPSNQSTYFYGMEKLTTLVTSVSLFQVFRSIQMRNHRWINTLATTTFGIYLIHEQPIVRQFLWHVLFQNAVFQNALRIIPYSVAVVLIVFIICAVLDFIRQQTIEKPYLKLVVKIDYLCVKLTNFVTSLFEKILG